MNKKSNCGEVRRWRGLVWKIKAEACDVEQCGENLTIVGKKAHEVSQGM